MVTSTFLGTSSRPIGCDRKLLHALFIEESLDRLRPLDADMQWAIRLRRRQKPETKSATTLSRPTCRLS